MYMCVPVCFDVHYILVVPIEAGRGHQIPRTGLEVFVSFLMWVLRTEPLEPLSFGRIAHALNC